MRFDDGHATFLTFALYPTVKFYEKQVTPPGVDGGGANDTTTHHNTDWRTNAPKKLKTLTESGAVVAYDPEAYEDAVAMVNINQLVTVHFPDGETLDFWGWLNRFVPGPASEGGQPTANVQVIPSNQDDDGNEVAPAFTGAA